MEEPSVWIERLKQDGDHRVIIQERWILGREEGYEQKFNYRENTIKICTNEILIWQTLKACIRQWPTLKSLRRRKELYTVVRFCNTDVSTPLKAFKRNRIWSTACTNAVPEHGKANIHIGRDIYRDTCLFQIHGGLLNIQTRLWYNGFGGWTNETAFKLEFEWTADRFARFEKLDKYIVTEHEFLTINLKPVM